VGDLPYRANMRTMDRWDSSKYIQAVSSCLVIVPLDNALFLDSAPLLNQHQVIFSNIIEIGPIDGSDAEVD
jgi:hypothetical protein